MKLRELEKKDAPYMLEWMHDAEVLRGLNAEKFCGLTIDDCVAFIKSCQVDNKNVHKAIVDNNDVYMGTVSLKNINNPTGKAEFAIVIRKSFQGKGYGKFAMNEIMRVAFEDLKLVEVYWNVLPNNQSAIRLYDNCRFQRVGKLSEILPGFDAKSGEIDQIRYCCKKNEFGV